jgi:tetratricopeptide (TPR) repeat protein
MLQWFRRRPTCPIEPDVRAWVDRRAVWIVQQFGMERVRRQPIILPNAEYFPDPYHPTGIGVRTLLDRVARYMGVDSVRIDIEFYSEQRHLAEQLALRGMQQTLGLYDDRDNRTTIWLEASHIDDPLSVVATLAHELAHVRLLGERRISPDEPDHEQLTDLLTVFLGLGVFTANSVIHSVSHRIGHAENWSVWRSGYLDAPVYGYAMALLTVWRGEASSAWARHLRPDVRVPFRQAAEWLSGSESSTRRTRAEEIEAEASRPAVDSLPVATTPFAPSDAEQLARIAETSDEVAQSHDEIDSYTLGVMLLSQQEYAEAIAAFDEALGQSPGDGEAYLQRAEASLALGQNLEALADAHQAVRLIGNEDLEAYRVRTRALLANDLFDAALADIGRVIAAMREMVRDDQRMADAYYLSGLARRGLGNLEGAVADWTYAVRLWPLLAQAYRARAAALESLGQAERAAADRRRADELEV